MTDRSVIDHPAGDHPASRDPGTIRTGRRAFLGGGAAVAAGLAAGLNPLSALTAAAAGGRPPREADENSGGYGPLVAKRPAAAVVTSPIRPDYDASREWLALPEGFEYVVFGLAGTTMTDGNRTPQAHDGMGAFDAGGGRVRLVRNHENRNNAAAGLPPIGGPVNAYDPNAAGGNSTIELSFVDGVPVVDADFVSLNGTIVNCAGGETPWGSWISCEETVETRGGIPHGYNFEIPSAANSAVVPVPLKKMGRFVHEAVAVDPATGYVYETEDRGNSGFYRFIPTAYGNLLDGELQMLKVKGTFQYDTKTGQHVGRALPVEWVTIDDPDPANPGSSTTGVFGQGWSKGGAVFQRLEGCWWGNGSVYFTATNGGNVPHGQIWEYKPAGRSDGFLKLVYESPDPEVLTFPDNINVTPRGGVLICEDTGFIRRERNFLDRGDGRAPFSEQFLKGLTRDSRIFDFGVNILDNREWAGACWSPDGRYLFVNTQGDTTEPGSVPGRTYAIWGPWERGAL